MTALQERIEKLKSELAPLKDWEGKYRRIIEWGQALPTLPDKDKTELAEVKGCQSKVWLHAQLSPEGQVLFRGDSDALIVRGLVALLLKIYSHSTPEEILSTPPEFLREIGLSENLTPSRANGLHAMIKQMRTFAQAFILLRKS